MPETQISPVFALSEQYVQRLAEIDPIFATSVGIPGYETEYPDFSPAGYEARAGLAKETLASLDGLAIADDRDRIAAGYLRERLEAGLLELEANEHMRAVRNLGAPYGAIRQVFDLMPRATVQDWEQIAGRLDKVPAALAGVRATLEAGRARGLVAAQRQAAEAYRQCATWAGLLGGPPFFRQYVAQAEGTADGALRQRLGDAEKQATAAYRDFAAYMKDTYAGSAPERDAVGHERYGLAGRMFLGTTIDIEATYAWGWDELHRIEAEMRATADQIVPGGSVDEAKEVLESDPARAIEGVDAFQRWMQETQDRTIAEMDGRHFDIPERVRTIEAMIAPPGTAAAMYYTRPNADFSRPGRTWYPTLGKTRFPLWGEVSIAYHEGVPGHHLQGGLLVHQQETISAYQRASFLSAYGEGWALYAERLMDELGYLENPDYRLGMLRAQAMRAVRVVVDIGMHLELAIPDSDAFYPGARWTPELGQAFVDERSHFPKDFMASEITRYLGNPAQAISYKVGERAWLEGREAAKARRGPAFDLKAFHMQALALGPLGLDQLVTELAACG